MRVTWSARFARDLPISGLMILWAVVNMIFLRGAPPPFSLTWQYEEAAQTKGVSVDQEIAGTSASFCQILMVPGLLQYAFSCVAKKRPRVWEALGKLICDICVFTVIARCML